MPFIDDWIDTGCNGTTSLRIQPASHTMSSSRSYGTLPKICRNGTRAFRKSRCYRNGTSRFGARGLDASQTRFLSPRGVFVGSRSEKRRIGKPAGGSLQSWQWICSIQTKRKRVAGLCVGRWCGLNMYQVQIPSIASGIDSIGPTPNTFSIRIGGWVYRTCWSGEGTHILWSWLFFRRTDPSFRSLGWCRRTFA